MIDQFLDGLTPSNYFITKSMEITKSKTSGTLWYLKKFLVLYDAIFLSKSIRTIEGVQSIVACFQEYIQSLPISQQEDATEFFFPPRTDLRENIKSYNAFAGLRDFVNEKERNSYYALVDKYYFIYLLDIGGQTGVKAYIKQNLYQDQFNMTQLENIIQTYANEHPEKRINRMQMIADFPASLRNERRILFYYGFVHARTVYQKSEREFCSLTPIGELSLRANASEFRLIWEHQKLKMISQPVTIDFPSIKGIPLCDATKFMINTNPYLSILMMLQKKGELSDHFYHYILSRTNDENILEVICHASELNQDIDRIKAYIGNFHVNSDMKSEDFDKEIKKYMLGIRDDLKKDHTENPYGLCSRKKGFGWIVTNSKRLEQMMEIYKQITDYKKQKYYHLFQNMEVELRQIYRSSYEQTNYNRSHKIKIAWDLYNIHCDKVMMLALLIHDYLVIEHICLKDIVFDRLFLFVFENYQHILEGIHLTNQKEMRNQLKKVVEALSTHTLSSIILEEENVRAYSYTNEYMSLNEADLWQRIEDVSKENVSVSLNRKRDSHIIDLLNAFYMTRYSDSNKLVSCDCCGKVTFLKEKGSAYLEFHHLIPFMLVDGPDHYENLIGICPNCHRKMHYGIEDLKPTIYHDVNQNNHPNKTIVERFTHLYQEGILKSYQLEYAIAEHMLDEQEGEQILA